MTSANSKPGAGESLIRRSNSLRSELRRVVQVVRQSVVGIEVETAVLLLGSTLIAIPTRIQPPARWILLPLCMLPFWFASGRAYRRDRSQIQTHLGSAIRRLPVLACATGLYLLLELLSFIRSSPMGLTPPRASLVTVTLVVFGLTVFFQPRSSQQRILLLGAGLISIPVLMVLNLALLGAGVPSGGFMYSQDPWPMSRLLASVGITASATLFPLASGVNGYGSVAGAGMCVGCILALGHRWSVSRLALALLWGLLCVGIIFMIDSRGALVFSILSVLLILVMPLNRRPLLKWLAASGLLLPPLMLLTINLMPGSWINQLGLGEETTVRELSGRAAIWSSAVDELESPSWQHFTGYGYAGHAVSGLADRYGLARTRSAEQAFVGLHNVYLQAVFDTGYLGAALLAVILFTLLRRLAQMGQKIRSPFIDSLLGFVVFLALLGSLDRVPSIYAEITFAGFLLAVLWVLAFSAHDGQWRSPAGLVSEVGGGAEAATS